MMKVFSIGLWAMVTVAWLHGDSSRTVFIPRSWYDVEELVDETRRQTGVSLTLQAKDELGKMVLYDNLTDMKAIKEAVLEYYQFVLGKQVKWFADGDGWLLREGSPVELGLAMDLMEIEKLWLKATARGAFEFLDLPPDPPVVNVQPKEVLEPKGQEDPALNQVPAEVNVAEPIVIAPPQELDVKEKVRAPYWLVVLWRRMLERLEQGGELERDRIRRTMRHEGLMGSVPLMELWLGKSLREFLMEPGSYAESRPTKGMIRGAGDLSVLAPSTQVRAHRLPTGTELKGMDSLPAIAGPSSQVAVVDLDTLADGRRADKQEQDLIERDDLISSIPPRRYPQIPHVAFRWPKHIVTLTSKSWWESFWKSSRPKHPKEKKVRPPSRRAIQRRDEAEQAFDRWADWNQERRSRDTYRRGEDL